MESGLSGDQRVAIVECIENYIGDWACPDPYDAADFIAARVLEITRAPLDAALVEAAIGAIALLDVAIAGTVFTKPQAGRITVNVERAQVVLDDLRAALAAAKGQLP